jgi:hypothetical protein
MLILHMRIYKSTYYSIAGEKDEYPCKEISV